MLKCPACGNTEFPFFETNQDFACPVAGCKGVVRAKREGEVRTWVRPAGGSFQWVSRQMNGSNGQEVQFLLHSLEEQRTENGDSHGE